MSQATGPSTVILAAGLPATGPSTATTAWRARGNTVKLLATSTVGGAGTLTITAKTSVDGVTYYDVADKNSVWSFATNVINTAGTYEIPLDGLAVLPGDYVRLYYACTVAAGTLALTAVNWENPAASSSVSFGDVSVDVADIETLLQSPATLTSTVATGAAAIATSTAMTAAFELDSITLHLSAAGTTAENFTVTLDAVAGAAYDTILFSLNLATDSVVNLVLTPGQDGLPRVFAAGDKIAVAWPNTETRTYGLRILTRGI